MNKRDIVISLFLLLFVVGVSLFLFIRHSQPLPKKIAQAATPSPTVTTPTQFYGMNVDMSLLLPESKFYVKNSKGQDLIDIAHALGMNMLRLTNSQRPFDTTKPNIIYTEAQWRYVLDKMATYHMQAIVLIDTKSTDQNLISDNINQAYINFVTEYAIDSQVGQYPNVYAFDIRNEPVLTPSNVTYLKKAADLIKKAYPNTKITVGGWRTNTPARGIHGEIIFDWNQPKDITPLADIVDFYTLHIYGFDAKTSTGWPAPQSIVNGYITGIEKYAGNKPMIIGEFGAPNGDAVSDQNTIGSDELQANVYNDVLGVVAAQTHPQLLGAIGYEMYTKSNLPEAWAISKDQGNYLYPAAYTFAKYTHTKPITSMTFPLSPVPNDFLLTEKNVGQEQKIKIGDVVGIDLNYEPAYTYALSSSNPVVLKETEAIAHGSVKIYAVLHALKTGNTTLTVNAQVACGAAMCTKKTFSYPIVVTQ